MSRWTLRDIRKFRKIARMFLLICLIVLICLIFRGPPEQGSSSVFIRDVHRDHRGQQDSIDDGKKKNTEELNEEYSEFGQSDDKDGIPDGKGTEEVSGRKDANLKEVNAMRIAEKKGVNEMKDDSLKVNRIENENLREANDEKSREEIQDRNLREVLDGIHADDLKTVNRLLVGYNKNEILHNEERKKEANKIQGERENVDEAGGIQGERENVDEAGRIQGKGENQQEVGGRSDRNIKRSNRENEKEVIKMKDVNKSGEMGKPVQINKAMISRKELTEYEEGWRKHNFNQYASDRISVRRQLPDPRDDECKKLSYDTDNLPTTSVIICFIDEAWSTLLRTVHSVLDRSPPRLIKEIILVDDYSGVVHLKAPLEKYFSGFEKVKIVRTSRREGLVRARLFGYRYATGDVITFLDSHCECTEGWLEPLLSRIKQNRSNVVWPLIDEINKDTFEFRYTLIKSGLQIGMFNWNMEFRWMYIPEYINKHRKAMTDPVASPTMAGGLFAIDREYFKYIGLYDAGMNIWGAENLELSFRIWMCGGKLEVMPCSHVGHVFRDNLPYNYTNKDVNRNRIRMVETWLDNYKQYYYERGGKSKQKDCGDISERLKLKEKLKCKSFQWYLDNVFQDAFLPHQALKSGQIRNKAKNVCMEARGRHSGKPVLLDNCHSHGGNQLWHLTKTGEIRRDDMCLDNQGNSQIPVSFSSCHGNQGNQLWEYTEANQIKNIALNVCIEPRGDQIIYSDCSMSEVQMWIWEPMGTFKQQKHSSDSPRQKMERS